MQISVCLKLVIYNMSVLAVLLFHNHFLEQSLFATDYYKGTTNNREIEISTALRGWRTFGDVIQK